MRQQVRDRIEAHNAQYATERKSYPRRIKLGDENCFWNILHAWAAQAAQAANSGQAVTNRVEINNKDVLNGRRDKSNVGRYLSKLGMAGLVGARRAEEGDPTRYQCQFEVKGGKGFGWVPVKRNRGTLKDYTILIDPALIPLQALPEGTPIFALDRIEAPDRAPSLVESFKVSLDKRISINEEMSQKARLAPPSAAKMRERQTPQAEAVLSDGKEKRKEKGCAAAKTGPQLVPVEMPLPAAPATPADTGSPIPTNATDLEVMFRKLTFEGKRLTALAMFLVSSYFKKLVPAMGKTEADYVPSQYREGVKQAERMLMILAEAQGNDLEKVSDVLHLTIDRMQQAIAHSPGVYAAPPGKWFNPDHKGNITVAYQKYLVPWDKTRDKLADLAKRRKLVAEGLETELEAQTKGKYYALAYALKKHLMRYHKTDSRVRSADLEKWAHTLRLMCERDKVPYRRACIVAEWWLLSDHEEARFFRSEIGAEGAPGGIRSARGLRRNWRAMERAWEQAGRRKAG